MFKNILKSICWLILYFATSLVGTIIAMIWYLLKDTTWMNSATPIEDVVVDVTLKAAIPGILIASIGVLLVYLIYLKAHKQKMGITTINKNTGLLCIGMGLALNVVLTALTSIASALLPESISDGLSASTELALTGNPIMIIATVGIFAPIAEEIIFRFGIHRTLARSNVIFAYIVSSIIFGIAHGNLIQAVYTAILGCIMAYMLTKEGNIIYAMLIHITVNLSSVMLSFMSPLIMLLSLAIYFALGCAIIAYTVTKKKRMQQEQKTENTETEEQIA